MDLYIQYMCFALMRSLFRVLTNLNITDSEIVNNIIEFQTGTTGLPKAAIIKHSRLVPLSTIITK